MSTGQSWQSKAGLALCVQKGVTPVEGVIVFVVLILLVGWFVKAMAAPN